MLSELRSKTIRDYISFQHKELSAESFIIENMTIDEMKEYHNKPRFSVTLIIDDEEVAVESEEDDEDEKEKDEKKESKKDKSEDNKANDEALAENDEEQENEN